MTLNRDGWFYFYAYLLSDIEPTESDLCRLFWRCFLLQPLKIGGLAVLLGCFIFLFFVVPVQAFGWLGLLVAPGAVAVLFGGVAGFFTAKNKLTDSEAYQYLKGNYCPKVKFESRK